MARLAATTAPRVRWCVENIRADKRVQARLQAEMNTAMRIWCGEASAWTATDEYRAISAADQVSSLLASWEYQLTRVLASTVGAKLVQQHSKSWVKGGNLLHLIRERDELRQQCEQASRERQKLRTAAPDVNPAMEWENLAARALHAQQAVRKEIHKRKRTEREQTFESVEQEWSNPKLFFHRVKQMRSGSQSSISAPVLRSKAGVLVSDLASRLDVTRQHYADLGTNERLDSKAAARPRTECGTEECIESKDDLGHVGFDEQFAVKIERRVAEMAVESLTQATSTLDEPWSAEEMELALKKLRNGKAPGPDCIHAEFLRYGGSELRRAMRILFNEILNKEEWPERWALGLICPIYKRAGAETELDNYRPITLLSIVSKLFELLMNIRFTEWSEKNRALRDEQGGFRTKRGCADQLFVLKEVWSSRRELKLPTYAAFLDVKAAYDRVWRTGLWHELYQCGIRGKAWRMVRAMYARMRRVVLVDGQRSSEFSVEVGVSQGSVLSPFLYSVFIDGLIRFLKSDPTLGVLIAAEPLSCLLYADDIVLLAPSAAILQRMLDLTSHYAHQWRFHFNGKKSQIVVQGSAEQQTEARQQPWRLDGQMLIVVPEYKYLGMECGLPPNRCPANSFVGRLVHATTHRAHDLLLAGCEMNELDARCSSRLWTALCRPILEYGSEVWVPNAGQAKQLDQVQGWFSRRVLGCSQGTPAIFATSELGLRSLELRRDQFLLRYWLRLCSALPERLLHRVFRERVAAVKATPLLTHHSLCHTLHATLCKYQLEEQWEQVATDQLYEAEEWHGMVSARVLEEELTSRQCTLASKSSLDTYAKALVPAIGKAAAYLLHSRNREGAWIRCRLRSNTLPLLYVLSRHCRPQRSDEHSICPLCPQSLEVESTEHFLSSCQSPRQCKLRQELCCRLQQSVQQWHDKQKAALMADWTALPLLAATQAVSIRQATVDAINGYDAICATLRAVSSASTAPMDSDTRVQWCELLLGRSTDPASGRAWDPSLLAATMRPIHNFLLLAWRARAMQLGGVPTLNPAGRGITIAPYRPMKSIGVRSKSRGGSQPLPARMQLQPHC
jgi:hypothetical protein